MNVGMGVCNLWLILVAIGIIAWLLMVIGDRLRQVKIENPEDHLNSKVAVVSSFPLLVFLGVTIFTPIVTGILFWIGCVLLVIAETVYVFSIVAFVKAQKGLTIIGIYKVSRNPMYVAIWMLFIALTLMAWQAESIMGILAASGTLLSVLVFHWMVLGEERFLSEKYGDAYLDYKKKTPRYIGIPRNIS